MSEIGQLIFTGISGITLTSIEKEFIQNCNIGGVILFSKNYDSPAQLAELINSIQVLRSDYPLFIAVDHEGGKVVRFKKNFTQFPSMYEISKLDSPKLCFEVHQIMAKELKACGVNLNLSPVCDIWTNPKNKVIGDRAFGNEADSVSKYISSAIRGLQTNDVLACAKHFPGHGNTLKDSHLDLPYIKFSKEELESRELIPFVKAIKSRVEFLMMAHLVVDSIDQELPCSLSKAAHDYAREKLRFNKIIISDDMQMGAITDNYGLEEAAVMAIKAGSDIIEYRDLDCAQRAYDSLEKAYKDKKILPQELQEKLKRIYDCKKTFLKDYRPTYIPSVAKAVGVQSHQTVLDDILTKLETSDLSP